MPSRITSILSLLIILSAVVVAAVFPVHAQRRPQGLKLVPQRIALANGKSFSLNLPEGFTISVAAQGLKRVRFMAKSPDDRIFVTDMYNLADNTKGVVYILDEFDPASETFPAGPMIIRYTAVIKDGSLHEVGDQIMPGKEPVRFFDMNLKRVADTDWPAGGAIPMK